MTSQSSSLRKLAAQDLKQSRYFMIMHFILLLLITSLPALLLLNNYNHQYTPNSSNILSDIYAALSASTPFTFFAVCIIGTIIGTMSYSYLFSQRSVIFYHSMPHKRETIFLSKAFSGILSIVVPLTAAFLVNTIIYVTSGLFSQVSFWLFIRSYLIILMMYVFVFSISSFAAVFSSNVFAHYIVIAFIYLVYPITALIFMGFFAEYTKTFSLTPFLFDKPQYLFPPLSMITNYKTVKTGLTEWEIVNIFDVSWKLVVYTVVISALAIALGTLLYRKRKTENTNKFVSFDVCKTFLKYYITSVVSVGSAMIFYELSYNSTIGGIAGLIIGGFIVYCVLQAIFEKSLKSMFTNMKSFALLTFILCIALVFSAKIAQGFDSSFPKNTEKIYISSPYLTGSYDMVLTFENPESVEAVTEFLNKAASSESENYVDLNAYTPSYDFWGIKRHFNNVSADDFNEFLSKIYDTDEYKNSMTKFGYPLDYVDITSMKMKYSGAVHLPDFSTKSPISEEAQNNFKKVFDILKKDIKNHTYEEVKNSDIEFTFSFNCYIEPGNLEDNMTMTHWNVDVMSCYTDTIEAMYQYGFIYEKGSNISKMAVMNHKTEGSDYESNYGIDDKELVSAVLDLPVKKVFDEYNADEEVTIRFYTDYGYLVDTWSYIYSDLPQGVKDFISENKIPYGKYLEKDIYANDTKSY